MLSVNVSRNVILPVEPALAVFEWNLEWYLPERDHTAPAAKASVEFSDQIQIEDVGIGEIVRKKLRSRSYSRGCFSVQQEKACTYLNGDSLRVWMTCRNEGKSPLPIRLTHDRA
jgi:hypothetical protein